MYTPSTTHPTAFYNPPMHTTNTRHSWQNGTRCRDGVNVLQCHSHLVWVVFEGSISTCACFLSENFQVCDSYKLDPGIRTDQQLGLNIRITISVCVLLYKPVHSYNFPLTFRSSGSSIENWHSIMRKGLINASGTKYQVQCRSLHYRAW